MAESDEDKDDSDPEIHLTGFLFGNIDESGQLENDILDSEAKRHLADLGRLGLSSLVKELIGTETTENKKDSENEEEKIKQNGDDRFCQDATSEESEYGNCCTLFTNHAYNKLFTFLRTCYYCTAHTDSRH